MPMYKHHCSKHERSWETTDAQDVCPWCEVERLREHPELDPGSTSCVKSVPTKKEEHHDCEKDGHCMHILCSWLYGTTESRKLRCCWCGVERTDTVPIVTSGSYCFGKHGPCVKFESRL